MNENNFNNDNENVEKSAVMTTEEFHRLLKENSDRQADARTENQEAYARIENEYTQAIDDIIEQENDALDEYRKARRAYEEAKDIYDCKVRQFKKMRNFAGSLYNQNKVKAKNLFAAKNERLASERHNIFERFRDSGGQFLDDASGLLHPSWTRQTKKSDGGVDDGSAAVQS